MTLLDGLSRNDVSQTLGTPFVHRRRALPDDVAAKLRDTFPTAEVMMSGRVGARRRLPDGSLPMNRKITFYFDEALDMPAVDPLWKTFVADHTRYDFFMSFVRLFETELFSRSPSLRSYLADLSPADVGLTSRPEDAGKKILIDGGLSLDTPGDTTSSSVIHLDNPRRIANILWYMRDEHDTEAGGDLEFFAPTGTVRVNTKMMVYPEYRSHMKKIGKIPFEHNTLFTFLNSPTAFHGVEPRPVFRRSFNMGFLVNYDLHDMSAYREHGFKKIYRKIRGDA